ncbi:MAG: YtxH domain-containing protein [Flavisolibacter sp.]|nr:YtxH domain-containing protein [Flavisolibacter sp.]
MNKILLGALIVVAVAGVVYYLYDPESFKDTVDDLKNKADDAYTKVKDKLSKSETDLRNTVS